MARASTVMSSIAFDTLSAPIRKHVATARDAGAYEQLVVRPQQEPQAEGTHAFERATAEELFARPVVRADEARCVLAGLWLLHDELDRAHGIVQEIGSASGSFWHAIMHRREGDFSNSKYWYARCREHPVMQAIDVSGPALVNLVEDAMALSPEDARYKRAVQLQRREWESLFDHCARAAVGQAS